MGLAQIKMPQLGESVTEGTVEKWLKSEGDFVKRDEPIVEVVTDKVNAEIPSPFEGKLVKITVTEGETVKVGAVIAQIETAAAGAATAAAPAPAPAKEPAAPTPPGEGTCGARSSSGEGTSRAPSRGARRARSTLRQARPGRRQAGGAGDGRRRRKQRQGPPLPCSAQARLGARH